jgi:hypothetical protein
MQRVLQSNPPRKHSRRLRPAPIGQGRFIHSSPTRRVMMRGHSAALRLYCYAPCRKTGPQRRIIEVLRLGVYERWTYRRRSGLHPTARGGCVRGPRKIAHSGQGHFAQGGSGSVRRYLVPPNLHEVNDTGLHTAWLNGHQMSSVYHPRRMQAVQDPRATPCLFIPKPNSLKPDGAGTDSLRFVPICHQSDIHRVYVQTDIRPSFPRRHS